MGSEAVAAGGRAEEEGLGLEQVGVDGGKGASCAVAGRAYCLPLLPPPHLVVAAAPVLVVVVLVA